MLCFQINIDSLTYTIFMFSDIWPDAIQQVWTGDTRGTRGEKKIRRRKETTKSRVQKQSNFLSKSNVLNIKMQQKTEILGEKRNNEEES